MLARLGVLVDAVLPRPACRCAASTKTCARALAVALTQAGIELKPGQVPTRIERRPATHGVLTLPTDERTSTCPWVLNATGRRPNTARASAWPPQASRPTRSDAVKVDAALPHHAAPASTQSAT